MATDWYYEIDGEENGPVGFDELQDLLRRERLHPDDLVWSDDLDDWTPARKVKGLARREGRADRDERGRGDRDRDRGPERGRDRERGRRRRDRDDAAPGGTPGIVIAGFVCAFFCPALGIILSAIGLGEAQRRRAGVGLAKAGLGIGIAVIVLSAIASYTFFFAVQRSVEEVVKTAVEADARAALQRVHLRQVTHRAETGAYTASFEELDAWGATRSPLEAEGYRLDMTTDGDSYECRATPLPRSGATEHYFIDETGALRAETGRRAGPESPLARKEAPERRLGVE